MNKNRFDVLVLGLVASGVAFGAMNSNMRVGPSATITYEAGRSALTSESKSKLSSLVQGARASGKIDEVQIAAWSDNPIPVDNQALSKLDRSLADRRANTLRDYLKKPLKVDDVVLHNMAERSTWLSRTFETDDAELKSEITRGAYAPMSKEEFRVFRANGKPSNAVVLVILKD